MPHTVKDHLRETILHDVIDACTRVHHAANLPHSEQSEETFHNCMNGLIVAMNALGDELRRLQAAEGMRCIESPHGGHDFWDGEHSCESDRCIYCGKKGSK